MAGQTATTPTGNEEVDTRDIEAEMDDVSWDDGEEAVDKTLNDKGELVEVEAEPKPKKSKSDEEDTSEADDVTEPEDDDASDEADAEDEATAEDDAETEEEVETDEDGSKDAKGKKQDTLTEEELDRKRHNDEMAKARIAEKRAKEEKLAAEKKLEDATIERYLRDAGEDQAELERRQLNVKAYRVQQEAIRVNEDKLEAGIQRAVAQIPLFRQGSKAVQEELAASLDDFERMYVRKDDSGRPVEVLGNVFDFLQTKANSIERLRSDGATRQVKSKTKQKSKTITPPVRAPKKAKEDPAMAGFDEEANRW